MTDGAHTLTLTLTHTDTLITACQLKPTHMCARAHTLSAAYYLRISSSLLQHSQQHRCSHMLRHDMTDTYPLEGRVARGGFLQLQPQLADLVWQPGLVLVLG